MSELIPKSILKYLYENPKIGRTELAKKAGISESDARFYCKLFKKKQENVKIKNVGIAAYDIHHPYHSKEAINCLFKVIKDIKPSIFILGGDNMDMDTISSYNVKKPKLVENKRIAKDYADFQKDILDPIETLLPVGCKKYFMLGNHEERVKWLIERQSNLEGLIEVDKNLKLDDWIVKDYKDVLQIDHMCFAHGIYYNKYHSEKNVRIYQKNIFTGHAHCFDDNTELLTKRGFLKFYELKKSDICLTFNKDTEKLEWQSINDIFIYDANEKMISINTSSIDLLVDEEHGLLGKWNEKGKLKLFKARDVFNKSSFSYFTSGELSVPNKDIDLSNDYLKLLAWIFSEGSIYQDKRYKNNYTIEISQSKELYIKQIKQILNNLHIKYSFKIKEGSNITKLPAYRFRIFGNDARNIVSMIGKNKHVVPNFLYELSTNQFEVFLSEYIKGDGTVYKNKNLRLLYSSDEDWIDFFQYMLFINGYTSKGYWRKGSFPSARKCCQLCFYRQNRSFVSKKSSKLKYEQYVGKKWCVSVDNKTLVVRRNNKLVVTQNTSQVYTSVSPVDSMPKQGVSVGCMCNRNPQYDEDKPNHWINQFLLFYLLTDGTFRYELITIIHGICIVNGKMYNGN